MKADWTNSFLPANRESAVISPHSLDWHLQKLGEELKNEERNYKNWKNKNTFAAVVGGV